jgi:hypothetical protein
MIDCEKVFETFGVRRPPACELVRWSSELLVRQSPNNKDVNTEVRKLRRWKPYQATTGEETAENFLLTAVNYRCVN